MFCCFSTNETSNEATPNTVDAAKGSLKGFFDTLIELEELLPQEMSLNSYADLYLPLCQGDKQKLKKIQKSRDNSKLKTGDQARQYLDYYVTNEILCFILNKRSFDNGDYDEFEKKMNKIFSQIKAFKSGSDTQVKSCVGRLIFEAYELRQFNNSYPFKFKFKQPKELCFDMPDFYILDQHNGDTIDVYD